MMVMIYAAFISVFLSRWLLLPCAPRPEDVELVRHLSVLRLPREVVERELDHAKEVVSG